MSFFLNVSTLDPNRGTYLHVLKVLSISFGGNTWSPWSFLLVERADEPFRRKHVDLLVEENSQLLYLVLKLSFGNLLKGILLRLFLRLLDLSLNVLKVVVVCISYLFSDPVHVFSLYLWKSIIQRVHVIIKKVLRLLNKPLSFHHWTDHETILSSQRFESLNLVF